MPEFIQHGVALHSVDPMIASGATQPAVVF
jgi:hypothetical protein